MEDQIAQLYRQAPRFDEGELYQSLAYQAALARRQRLQAQMRDRFGLGVEALLQAYTDTLYDEMELETQHFFREGYKAAHRDNA